MLFTGWEVCVVRNCARGLEYRPRAQFLTIRTDLGRWITFLFFSYWDLKVSGKFYFSLQPMCVEEGRVRVDVIQGARSIANQNKTLQHNFKLVIYVITIKLSFRIKKRFLCLGRQFIIWASNKDIRIDELKSHRKENTSKIFFSWIFTLRLIQSSVIKTAQRLYKKS